MSDLLFLKPLVAAIKINTLIELQKDKDIVLDNSVKLSITKGSLLHILDKREDSVYAQVIQPNKDTKTGILGYVHLNQGDFVFSSHKHEAVELDVVSTITGKVAVMEEFLDQSLDTEEETEKVVDHHGVVGNTHFASHFSEAGAPVKANRWKDPIYNYADYLLNSLPIKNLLEVATERLSLKFDLPLNEARDIVEEVNKDDGDLESYTYSTKKTSALTYYDAVSRKLSAATLEEMIEKLLEAYPDEDPERVKELATEAWESDDWIDPAGGMHTDYDDDDDPAAMYASKKKASTVDATIKEETLPNGYTISINSNYDSYSDEYENGEVTLYVIVAAEDGNIDNEWFGKEEDYDDAFDENGNEDMTQLKSYTQAEFVYKKFKEKYLDEKPIAGHQYELFSNKKKAFKNSRWNPADINVNDVKEYIGDPVVLHNAGYFVKGHIDAVEGEIEKIIIKDEKGEVTDLAVPFDKSDVTLYDLGIISIGTPHETKTADLSNAIPGSGNAFRDGSSAYVEDGNPNDKAEWDDYNANLDQENQRQEDKWKFKSKEELADDDFTQASKKTASFAVDLYFVNNGDGTGNIAVPGFNDIVILPLEIIDNWISENWGHSYILSSTEEGNFHGSSTVEGLYEFLINNKVNINDYVDYYGDITSADGLADYFVEIRKASKKPTKLARKSKSSFSVGDQIIDPTVEDGNPHIIEKTWMDSATSKQMYKVKGLGDLTFDEIEQYQKVGRDPKLTPDIMKDKQRYDDPSKHGYEGEQRPAKLDKLPTKQSSKKKADAEKYTCPHCNTPWDEFTTVEDVDDNGNAGIFPECPSCGNRISDIALFWRAEFEDSTLASLPYQNIEIPEEFKNI